MNGVSHIIVGCIVGICLFFGREILFIDIVLFILLSVFMDLDHVVNWLRGKSKYHLRSFVQEPSAILLIAIPLGYVLGLIFGDFIYFWLCFIIYNVHIFLDYICVFEAYPLDPFTTKIVKREGYGLVLPLLGDWKARKGEFPRAIGEEYILIILACLLALVIVLYLVP